MSVLATQKGDKVVLLGFTGIRLAEVEIAKATKTSLTVIKADGKELVFDRKTGIQTNTEEGKEKYANKIVHPTNAPAPKKKAAPKKVAPKVVEEVEVDEEDDEEEEEKPKKKPAKKVEPKKKKKVVEVEEDDEDDYEEL